MNQYWLIAFLIFLAAVGFVGEQYGENRVKVQCDQHDEEQQQKTIEAQQHVLGQVQTQNQISQGAENDYNQSHLIITDLYADGMPSAPSTARQRMCAVSTTACGIQTSKKYKLTPQQCDDEEAKCDALWNWTQRQATVK